ncbi:glycosyltransferase [Herbiconiux ginsengi]|uniref:Glycosyltransferase involved in cell wall bisynthesis n=1 Tax=Herbiconiux ginsengi TaxID=381665 RepID=A0A1H3SQ65_9MICO|nr:glycosyltransferase [Herbiconiux ginsengi]SDZ39269.1 Glycosyltransferase involved in cell wall bisynthesis [Herbiconiux ginsengi]
MTNQNSQFCARYYYVARTVHLERLADYHPAWFFYTKVRADFDPELAASMPYVQQRGALSVAWFVARNRIDVLELPEALAVRVWPQAFAIHMVVAMSNVFKRRKTRIVTYAIENYPADRKLAYFTKMPIGIARLITKVLAGFLLHTTARVVFGTRDAEENYARQLPGAISRPTLEKDLIWALPSQLEGVTGADRQDQVVFLGTFEERKGIFKLIESWPAVRSQMPDARFLIMGKSGEIERVREFARAHEEVQLIEDPSRELIFGNLRASKTLVLFSQQSGIWKEQVGLPILEGLSCGCEIVSSDQTGIAGWLASNGHEVVAWQAEPSVLANAIVRSLRNERGPLTIAASLPRVDSRLEADRVLFSPDSLRQ